MPDELDVPPETFSPRINWFWEVTNNLLLSQFIQRLTEDIKNFTKASNLYILKDSEIDKKDFAKSFSGIIGDLEVYLPFEGLIELDSLKERLSRDFNKVNNEIKILKSRFSNKNFVDKAPKEIVHECQMKLNEATAKADSILKKINMLA